MPQRPRRTHVDADDESLPLGTMATIASTEDPVVQEPLKSAHRRRNLLRQIGSRIRHPQRGPQVPRAGMTLVGGEMLPALNSMSTLSTTFDDVLQVEGIASSSAKQHQLFIWLFQSNETPIEITLEDLPNALEQEGSFIWIDLARYNEIDLSQIGRMLNIQRAVLRTIISPWHRPSLAVYPDQMYLSATVAHLDAKNYHVHASELDICMSQRFLVSVHKQPLPFLDRIVARTQQTPELVRTDPAYLLYQLMDELLAYYEEINRHIQVESEQIEERALRDASDAFLEDLLRFKRYAFAVSQLVDQHREVFAAFFRPDFEWVSGGDVEGYFRDLQARLAHLLAMLLVAKESVNSAFNIYVSQISHRTNQIIKVLTMVSTLLLPATLIIALFGTSVVGLMPKYGSVWFVIMLVSILLISIGTLYLFSRQRWIDLRLGSAKFIKGDFENTSSRKSQ